MQFSTAVLDVLDERVFVNAVFNISTVEALATGVSYTATKSVGLIAVIGLGLT